MNASRAESTAVGLGVAYLLGLTWAMANVSYDIWGAFIIGPVLLIVGVAMLRRLFRGAQSEVYTIMTVGLIAKLAGGIARYWVSFDAYGGATDAQRYHQYGAEVATAAWRGEVPLWDLVPRGIGTEFLERFTALAYTLTGTSRLGGFFVFAWIAYWGVALMVKAALIAIPGLARRRYALLATLAPSIVFWPSSIGKEAYMFLTLGLGTFGIARLVSRRGLVVSLAITLAGLGGAAFVRPHIVAIWVAGFMPALLVVAVRGRRGVTRTTGRRATDALAAVLLLAAASVALVFAARATVDYLDPSAGDETQVSSASVTDILAETTRRTSEQGSTYPPPSVESPTDWPYATLRTIFRPLLIEARGLGQLLAAVELTAFLGLCLLSWPRVRRLPRELVTNPYVAFAITTLLFGGLAYASFANLGVLTRQKSLIFPFLLLIPCLPEVRQATRKPTPSTQPHTREFLTRESLVGGVQNSSTSPRERDQLASGGVPASFTARHVRTGPPPGSGSQDEAFWGGPSRIT